MIASPINASLSTATQTLHETLHLTSTTLPNAETPNKTTTSNRSVTDSITLSKSSYQFQSKPSNQYVLDKQVFFSYVDTLLQQWRGQALIQQALNGTGNSSAGVLGNFQTLQYQRDFFDQVFNQKGDNVMNMFKTTV